MSRFESLSLNEADIRIHWLLKTSEVHHRLGLLLVTSSLVSYRFLLHETYSNLREVSLKKVSSIYNDSHCFEAIVLKYL
ncbi:hypothetical protein [Nostoc sp.]|uniref:hypothetical protein n=1 Tax=Nostoc sp. TaxID=1180 RepID=UPI003593D78C